MEIRCMNVGNIEELTENKKYDVIRSNDYWYWIINDNGKENVYNKLLFQKVEEKKELNIIEAMKMPIETEFIVIFENGETFDCHAKIIERLNHNAKKRLVWDNRAFTPIDIDELSANAKFIPIQKPVSFIEAVASNKRIKVIHSNFVSTDRFMTIPEMLNCMSRYSRPIELIEIGEWYIED